MATFIKKNQDLDVRKAVVAWMAHNQKDADAILYGKGEIERHTPCRLERIREAYTDGTADHLPPVTWCPQYGTITDGRHRIAVAYLNGIKKIKADFIYNVPDDWQ